MGGLLGRCFRSCLAEAETPDEYGDDDPPRRTDEGTEASGTIGGGNCADSNQDANPRKEQQPPNDGKESLGLAAHRTTGPNLRDRAKFRHCLNLKHWMNRRHQPLICLNWLPR